jgi:3-methyladenine DNA glycosylase AlkD
MFALIVLTYQFEKAEKKVQEKIYKFYLKNTKYINNWDLVDTSAHKIVGAYIQQKPKAILKKLVRSKNMWERRIAVIATFQLIKMGRLKETFELSKMLLTDDHDLMHKAVGWMLREAGKKDIKKLEAFLKKNHAHMPRTMLRYSIEKFPEAKRKKYLKGIV